MFCSKCGFDVPDGAPFCPSCGKPMQSDAMPEDRNPVGMNPSQPAFVPSVQKNKNLPVIIGCVVGGIVLLILIIVLISLLAGGVSDLDDVDWDDEQAVGSDSSVEAEDVQFEWVKEPFFKADDMSNVFDYTGNYPYDGYTIYYVDGKCGIVDSQGNKICEPLYTDPDYCQPEQGIVFDSHRWIFWPDAGGIVEHGGHGGGFTKLIYDINSRQYICIAGGDGPSEEISYDTTGCYIVYECSKVISESYDSYVYYNYNETGRIGLYNNGELVVPFEYELTTGLADGIVGMYDGESWTYFDAEGNIVYENVPTNGDVLEWNKLISASEYIYQDMYTELVYKYCCKCVPVKIGDKWGYMDSNGEMIIDAQFEKALPAFNYRAWVCVDGVWGIISIG